MGRCLTWGLDGGQNIQLVMLGVLRGRRRRGWDGDPVQGLVHEACLKADTPSLFTRIQRGVRTLPNPETRAQFYQEQRWFLTKS